jgi:hypothetical protein
MHSENIICSCEKYMKWWMNTIYQVYNKWSFVMWICMHIAFPVFTHCDAATYMVLYIFPNFWLFLK